jgi:hypothetical protein
MSSVTKPEPQDSLSHAEVTERRWMRFPADESRVYFCLSDGQELSAIVRDESFGGIAISLESLPAEISPGLMLDIEYAGAPMGATVRRVLVESTGQTLVGLEWT